MLIKGSELTADQLKQVQGAYVYRYHSIGEGKAYSSEQAWIEDHAFHFTKLGNLSKTHKHCLPAFMAD